MTQNEVERELNRIRAEVSQAAGDDTAQLLGQREGYADLLQKLPAVFPPSGRPAHGEQETWDRCGQYYRLQGRFHEALAIYHGWYDQVLAHQDAGDCYLDKGAPLVWASDCHLTLGRPVLTKRYLMLTLCEDTIRERGNIPLQTTGAYFRLVWLHGMSHQEFKRYESEIWAEFRGNQVRGRYPEWILQKLDQDWMVEYPSPGEAGLYVVNLKYVRALIGRLGTGAGSELELLADYLVASMPGCRTYRRGVSRSTDYDVICSLEGVDLDFRAELGRYFVCECKDWDKPADFAAFAKFCRVLDSVKCRFGILFSREGITGLEQAAPSPPRFAAAEQLKVFQDRGMVVVVISQQDLERVAAGENFITMLRSKYEAVRLDLRGPTTSPSSVTKEDR